MNKKVIGALVVVVILGAIGVILANLLSEPEAGGTPIRTTDQVIENPQPAVQAQGNTFGIMTPEEKAAKEAEEARLAAQASSSASTTATSTDKAAVDVAIEAETTN